jgi:hypothetical protein
LLYAKEKQPVFGTDVRQHFGAFGIADFLVEVCLQGLPDKLQAGSKSDFQKYSNRNLGFNDGERAQACHDPDILR